MKNQFTTAIEITDTNIKVLQSCVSKRENKIVSCDVKEITPQSDAEISKILSGMIKHIKEGQTIAVIPRRFAIMRYLSLPSHSDSEIEKMVGLQIVKQIPYPKDDIILDFNIVEKESSGYTKVLVIAVHKEIISRYLKIFRDAKVSISKLTLSSEGLINWYAHYLRQNKKDSPDNPTLLVNVDTSRTELCLCSRKSFLFSRSINFGSKDLADENNAPFVEQIELTVSTFIKENIGRNISKIVLVSPLKKINELKEKLNIDYEKNIDSNTAGWKEQSQADSEAGKIYAESIDPAHDIDHKQGLDFEAVLKGKGVSLAVCIGLITNVSQKSINLLPEEVQDTRNTHQQKKQWISSVMLFALAFSLGIMFLSIKMYKKKFYVKELQNAINEAKPKINAIKEKNKRIDFIRKRLNPTISVNDIIYELHTITPDETSFKAIRFTNDGMLTLQGASRIEADVNILQRKLVNSPLFENVTLQYATKRKIFKGELTDFKILCRIAEEGKSQ